MANKLKNMRLTSVDLVRNGANQEADICLFKSTDPEEDPVQPTTEEKNIFKRFLNWLNSNPAEDDGEPDDPIEKADDQPEDIVDIYKSAITVSLQSIVTDDSLSIEKKHEMIAKSMDEYHEAMLDLLDLAKAAPEDEDEDDWDWEDEEEEDDEEVEKFNPYHDSKGRFASAGGGGKFYATPGKSRAHDLAIERETKRQTTTGGGSAGESGGQSKGKFDTDKQTKEVQDIKGYVGDDKVYDEIDSKLSPLFGDGKDTRLYSYDLEYGGIDKVAFFGSDEISNGKTTALVSFWAKDVTTGERVSMEDQIEVRVTKKSADIDEIEEV